MMYYDFTAGDRTYRLRLSTRNTVALERQLGCNPIAIFGEGNTIPTVTTMVTILHQSMQQYEHGIGLDAAYDIFDRWLADGHTVTDFLSVIIEVYKVSGIMRGEGEGAEKN